MVVWLVFNIVVNISYYLTFVLWVFKGNPYSAVTVGLIALVGIIIQPWIILLAFLPWPWNVAAGIILGTLVNTFVYNLKSVQKFLTPAKKFLKSFNKKQLIYLAVAYLMFVTAVFILRLIDLPPLSIKRKVAIEYTIEQSGIPVYEVKKYDLGGFIDREYLWKGRVESHDWQNMINKLNLGEIQRIEEVPRRFFRMPPYWWNASKKGEVKFYKSEYFRPHQRGGDGVHYLCMYDEESHFLYVWIKDNF